MNGVVPSENLLASGQSGQVLEGLQKVVPVGMGRKLPEIEFVFVHGYLQSFSRPCNFRRVNKAVVLEKPDEHARENPRGGFLGDLLGPPLFEACGGTLGLFRLSIFAVEHPVDFGRVTMFFGTLPKVFFEAFEKAFQILQQLLSADHVSSRKGFFSGLAFIGAVHVPNPRLRGMRAQPPEIDNRHGLSVHDGKVRLLVGGKHEPCARDFAPASGAVA